MLSVAHAFDHSLHGQRLGRSCQLWSRRAASAIVAHVRLAHRGRVAPGLHGAADIVDRGASPQ